MKAIFAIALVCLSMTANGLIYATINKADIAAGQPKVAQTLSDSDVVTAIINGYLAGLGITTPHGDAVACIDSASASTLLSHLASLSSVSASTNRANLASAVGNYLETIGNRLYESLSDDFLQCLATSQDGAEVVATLGVSPLSADFATKVVNNIAASPINFQTLHNFIALTLNAANYDAAGRYLASYHKIVVQA